MSGPSQKIVLPKDALQRINLGQSFAEYDKVLMRPGVFVSTPATYAAEDPVRSKCFFVGRRGTGKTAITLWLNHKHRHVYIVNPNIIVPTSLHVAESDFKDPKQKPFKSLVTAFELNLYYESLACLVRAKALGANSLQELSRDRNLIEQHDFDSRMPQLFDDTLQPVARKLDEEWVRQIKRSKHVGQCVDSVLHNLGISPTLIIDRIDEAWDGSDKAVVCLMGLMHACLEIGARSTHLRPLLFIRENIFERVRLLDPEFARLETAVVSLEWPRELLLELIERRLALPFNTKLPLRGPTWDYFIPSEGDFDSRAEIFDYCQNRPRDVLTFVAHSIEAAQGRKHDRVTREDVTSAKKRFSENRHKDLCDEYSENYPRIDMVLTKFFGLASEYTVNAISEIVRMLLNDSSIKELCKEWLYSHSAPEKFMELLFNVGFAGIRNAATTTFRSVGVRTSSAPFVSSNSVLVVHPSYHEALGLQPILMSSLAGRELRSEGLVDEIPEGIPLPDYTQRLDRLLDQIASIRQGRESYHEFEELVGDVIRLCFFKVLVNVEAKSRTANNIIVRDWICSNVGPSGFWEMIRGRYGATQVVWECKNYAKLKAEDFQQASYYMSSATGRFVIVVFRGEIADSYYEHIAKVEKQNNGIVLLLNDNDLRVFVRQAKNFKVKDGHLRERFDSTVRKLS